MDIKPFDNEQRIAGLTWQQIKDRQQGIDIPEKILPSIPKGAVEFPQYETKVPEKNKTNLEQPQGEFKYRLLYRPLSIGTHPKEGFVKHEEDGTKYGQLTYNRKLSKEEVKQFELEPVVNTDIYNGKDIVYMEEGADKYLATVSFTEYRGRKFAQIAKRDLEGITYETETLLS